MIEKIRRIEERVDKTALSLKIHIRPYLLAIIPQLMVPIVIPKVQQEPMTPINKFDKLNSDEIPSKMKPIFFSHKNSDAHANLGFTAPH